MGIIEIALGLAQFAPMVAGWIAGPKAQDNAQKVIDIAERVMPGTPQDQLAEAFKADPAKALEFQKAAAEQHTAMMNAVLADIQDSRKTMVSLANVGSPLAWGAAIVSALVIAANGAMGYFIFTGKIPPENKELAMLYAGSLLAALGGCIAFWTGSSMGSMQKTNLLAK
jgi:hypothetical protein